MMESTRVGLGYASGRLLLKTSKSQYPELATIGSTRFAALSPQTKQRTALVLWTAVLGSLMSVLGGGSPERKDIGGLSQEPSVTLQSKDLEDIPLDKLVTETKKDPSVKPELSWLKRSGPTREIDVATLIEVAQRKDKALDDKLKLKEIQDNADRLKRVTEVKTKLSKALTELEESFKKDPDSDATTQKAQLLYKACIVDPSLRTTKETWAPNTVRWAACDQMQTAGFHKIIDPLIDVLELPESDGLYAALTAVQRIPALAPKKSASDSSPSVAAHPLSAPQISVSSWMSGTSTGVQNSLNALSLPSASASGSPRLILDDDLLFTRPTPRVRIANNPFESAANPDFSWNASNELPWARTPRRTIRLEDLGVIRPQSASNPSTRVTLTSTRLTERPAEAAQAALAGNAGRFALEQNGLSNLIASFNQMGPMPRIVSDSSTTTASLLAHSFTTGHYGLGMFGFFGGRGDGRPQVRLASPNVADLKGSWVKANNADMAGKRKVMVVYHSQETFKPEVIIFIKKMASVYGMSLGDKKPSDIDKLIRAEKSADFGDFIVVCPKGKTAQSDLSSAFDRMQKFSQSTPGAEGFVYIDAHGSQGGPEAGLEDLDMLEGARKGTTHFPEAEIDKTFWMNQSHKLKDFKGAVPFIIDTCHSAANIAMAETLPTKDSV